MNAVEIEAAVSELAKKYMLTLLAFTHLSMAMDVPRAS